MSILHPVSATLGQMVCCWERRFVLTQWQGAGS
jgi:hypothetical protein